MIECASACLYSSHGARPILPASACLAVFEAHSFWGKSCVMGMRVSMAPSHRHRCLFYSSVENLCGGICFPKRKGAASTLNLFLYHQQLYDSGTNPDTVSLCSSHQTRPRMPASVCLAALEVPSFVVGICVLGMISWNALWWNFLFQWEEILLQL